MCSERRAAAVSQADGLRPPEPGFLSQKGTIQEKHKEIPLCLSFGQSLLHLRASSKEDVVHEGIFQQSEEDEHEAAHQNKEKSKNLNSEETRIGELTCGEDDVPGHQLVVNDGELRELDSSHSGHCDVSSFPVKLDIICSVTICKPAYKIGVNIPDHPVLDGDSVDEGLLVVEEVGVGDPQLVGHSVVQRQVQRDAQVLLLGVGYVNPSRQKEVCFSTA
ncbi:hypothetical protein F7725_027388, partial [Dissostichus mawsoni]